MERSQWWTFLFTDIEGSTSLVQRAAQLWPPLLEEHDRILHRAVVGNGGRVIGQEGDAVFAAFSDPLAAVRCAIEAQHALLTHSWPDGLAVRVRMGIHAGPADPRGDDFVGITLHEAARIASAAHGGQVLCSAAAARDLPSQGVALHSLGLHGLKDLHSPLELFQVLAAGLPDLFPPVRSLRADHSNVPSPPAPLIGRQAEVTEVMQRLRGETRLLTIVGPGGAGKTRLALEVAARLEAWFPGGVHWIELASVREVDVLLSAIASVVRSRSASLEDITAELGAASTLLVLDNVEQIPEAGVPVSQLIQSSPALRVLVTSQRRLGVRVERVLRLGGLDVHGTGSAAVRLLVDRTDAVGAPLDLGDAAVAEPALALCQLLDGLPLAIELAAARLPDVPLGSMLEALQESISVLREGPLDLPDRHRALASTLEWTHALLDDPHQALYRRLGAFAGRLDVDAVTAVCSGPPIGPNDVARLLEGLTAVSLVADSADGTWRMLAVVVRDARERLAASGEQQLVDGLHRRLIASRLEELFDPIVSKDQAEALAAVGRMLPDVRSAIGRAVAETAPAGAADELLPAARALARGWFRRGDREEGLYWLSRLLTSTAGDSLERGILLHATAVELFNAGADAAAESRADEALAMFERIGDKYGVARCLSLLASLAAVAGNRSRAGDLATKALEVARETGRDELIGGCLTDLAKIRGGAGDAAGAMGLLEESLVAFHSAGDHGGTAGALTLLARLHLESGERDDARAVGQEALDIAVTIGDEIAILEAELVLAEIEEAVGDAAARRQRLVHAAELARTTGRQTLAAQIELVLAEEAAEL